MKAIAMSVCVLGTTITGCGLNGLNGLINSGRLDLEGLDINGLLDLAYQYLNVYGG